MKIISKKYDGSLRDENMPLFVEHHTNAVIAHSFPGHPYLHHKSGEWKENENGLIEIFFTDRWYNVMHIFEHTRHQDAMYINLCLPAKIEGNVLIWVDMDLDLKVGLDGNIELLDEEEFELNSNKWKYPEEVKTRMLEEAFSLPAMIQEGLYPFNYQEQAAKYTQWKKSQSPPL